MDSSLSRTGRDTHVGVLTSMVQRSMLSVEGWLVFPVHGARALMNLKSRFKRFVAILPLLAFAAQPPLHWVADVPRDDIRSSIAAPHELPFIITTNLRSFDKPAFHEDEVQITDPAFNGFCIPGARACLASGTDFGPHQRTFKLFQSRAPPLV